MERIQEIFTFKRLYIFYANVIVLPQRKEFCTVVLKIHNLTNTILDDVWPLAKTERMNHTIMKAVIMAGGEGSRLRPLTCDIPKPMSRLCGRPILEYILDLLEAHGTTQAAVTLRYLPDRIAEHFPGSVYKGMKLAFIEEDKPLGTAGSVKNACRASDTEILVISGDAMCDFDLTAAIAHHRATAADVTILAKKVDDPREYGLIAADQDGNIQAFIEKPAFSQAVSDLANTGIYILSRKALDLIPDDTAYDFAKNLFPLMLERKMKLVCWEGQGYWCDIGDLDSYVRCQRDMLEGRVRCEIQGTPDRHGNILRGALPQGKYTVQPPVYMGRGVRIEDGARIESGSVIDDGCYIGRSARVSGSVLLQNSYVGQRARLTGALVCAAATVKAGAMLFEGAAVGAGAVVGEKSTINAGVKVWNKKVIPGSVVVAEHVKLGGENSGHFDDDGITGQVGVELTPEFCARLGSAIGSLFPGVRLGVGCSPHRSAAALAAAVSAGIQSTGAGVMDFGENFQAQFEFCMNFCGLGAGVYISGDNRAFLRVVGNGGLPATRELERNIEGVLSRGEFTRCAWDDVGDKVEMTGMSALYKSQLIRFAPKGLPGMRVQVRSRNLAVQSMLRDTLYSLGCDGAGEFVVELSAQGDKLRAYDPDLGYIPHHKILTLCAAWQMERGQDAAVPFDAPRALDNIAEKAGRKLQRYFTCPADSSDAEARKLAKIQMWSRDGLMQAIILLNTLRRAGGFQALLTGLPEYEMESRTVDIAGNPAGFIRGLDSRHSDRITEGVVLQRDNGIVLVRPLKRGTGIKIMAEARSAEIAEELCADVERLLQKRQPGE